MKINPNQKFPAFSGLPIYNIAPSLLENFNEFQAPFFQQFSLRHAPEALRLNENITKDYFFPTLYGDVTNATALFMCSYEQAAKLMPDSSLKPVNMGFGRALVVFSSFRYNKVFGISPYNEVAISIPVVPSHQPSLPVLPLLFADRSNLGFYVISMPVTSLENKIRGRKIWGLPKVLQQIELQVDGSKYVTRVHDEEGEIYLEFQVPMTGKPARLEQKTRLISRTEGGQILNATSTGSGDFAVTSWPHSRHLKTNSNERPFISFGASQSSQLLRDLKIASHPFEVRFGANVQSVFDLPYPQKNH
jgi:hypothetical protein